MLTYSHSSKYYWHSRRNKRITHATCERVRENEIEIKREQTIWLTQSTTHMAHYYTSMLQLITLCVWASRFFCQCACVVVTRIESVEMSTKLWTQYTPRFRVFWMGLIAKSYAQKVCACVVVFVVVGFLKTQKLWFIQWRNSVSNEHYLKWHFTLVFRIRLSYVCEIHDSLSIYRTEMLLSLIIVSLFARLIC